MITCVGGTDGKTLVIVDRDGRVHLRINGRHGGLMAGIWFTRADLAALGHELTRLYADVPGAPGAPGGGPPRPGGPPRTRPDAADPDEEARLLAGFRSLLGAPDPPGADPASLADTLDLAVHALAIKDAELERLVEGRKRAETARMPPPGTV